MHPELVPYYAPSLDKKPPAPSLVGQEALKFAELQQSLHDGVGSADNSFVTEEREYKKLVAEIGGLLKDLENDRESQGAEFDYHERLKYCQDKIAELKEFIDKKLNLKYGYERRLRSERNKKEKMYTFAERDRSIVLEGEPVSLVHLNLADLPVVRHSFASDEILYGKEGEGVKITIMPLNNKLDISVTVGKNFYSSYSIDPTPEAFRKIFDNLFTLVQEDEHSDFANGPTPSPAESTSHILSDSELTHGVFRHGVYYPHEVPLVAPEQPEPRGLLSRLAQRFKRPLLGLGIAGALFAVPEKTQPNEENPRVLVVKKNDEEALSRREREMKDILNGPVAPDQFRRLVAASLAADRDLNKYDRHGKSKYDRVAVETAFLDAFEQLKQGQDAVIHGILVLKYDTVAPLLKDAKIDDALLNKKRFTKIVKPLLRAAKKKPQTHRHHS